MVSHLFLSTGWELTVTTFPEQRASEMGFDTGKEVNQVCFILIKETETQKTSLQVPLINPDKNTTDSFPDFTFSPGHLVHMELVDLLA